VWFEPSPELQVAKTQAELDPDLRLNEGVSLPLPTSYVAHRDSYTLVVSTPVSHLAHVYFEAKKPDGGLLSLKGHRIVRHTMAPPGQYFFNPQVPGGSINSLPGFVELTVHDESGARLGSERFTYRLLEYGAVWDTDCI